MSVSFDITSSRRVLERKLELAVDDEILQLHWVAQLHLGVRPLEDFAETSSGLGKNETCASAHGRQQHASDKGF